jgi:CheY-like chemotaxis protein
MKLLIAEDDAFFRKLLEQILASDYELVLAENGEKAWAELQRNDGPRLAILDWVMPGMTGPQVCREVRQSPHLCSMYLIILTAKNSVADGLARRCGRLRHQAFRTAGASGMSQTGRTGLLICRSR